MAYTNNGALHTLGNLGFYGIYAEVIVAGANPSYNNRQTASDVLVGDEFLYIPNCNLNYVYIYRKNNDGSISDKYGAANWYSQDTYIDRISRNSSSVPSAYAVYTTNGQDKLVGWSMDDNLIFEWDIVNGNISNRKQYPAPVQMTAYSRGGWDGGNYIYFVDRSSSLLYRWDIKTKASPTQLVYLGGYSSYVGPSFTGSGLLVDAEANEVYASSGANQNDSFLTCWNLTTGAYKDRLTVASQFESPVLNGAVGSIILNPSERNIAYYISMYQSKIIELNMGVHNGVAIYSEELKVYSYTGGGQIYIAPVDGMYLLEAWGAQGGDSSNTVNTGYHGTAKGGKGGYSRGEVFLHAGQLIYIYVGGQGGTGGDNSNPPGGYNGGGDGRLHGGAGGGGATDIRIGGYNLINRIIVAGGGGGALTMGSGYSATGGFGGGDTGGYGAYNNWSWGYEIYSTNPGTQFHGGQYNYWSNDVVFTGTLGQGGNAYSSYIGGGGGGYYGGASGFIHGWSGAGGSGFVGELINALMIPGNAEMPAPSGGAETGHTGHGRARITLIGLNNYKGIGFTLQNNIRLYDNPNIEVYKSDAIDTTNVNNKITYKYTAKDTKTNATIPIVKTQNNVFINNFNLDGSALNIGVTPVAFTVTNYIDDIESSSYVYNFSVFKYNINKTLVCNKIIAIKPIQIPEEFDKIIISTKHIGTNLLIGVSIDNGTTWSIEKENVPINISGPANLKILFFCTEDVELKSYSIFHNKN